MQQTDQQLRFSILLQRHNGILHKILKKYCKDEMFKDDLYQDICLKAWNAYESFRGRSEFSSWLYRIAHNTAISRLRKAQLKTILTDNIFWEIADTPYDEYVAPISLSIMDSLTTSEKRTLQMRMDGLSFAEISEQTGEPINRLTVRIHRIKKLLSKSIKQTS